MLGGFKKNYRRNFRKKVVTEDGEDLQSDDDQPTEKAVETPVVSLQQAPKEPKKTKSSKGSASGKGLLSFEDDMDTTEEFQVRKTKESRMLAKRLEQEKKRKKTKPDDPNDTQHRFGPRLPPTVVDDIIIRGSPFAGSNNSASKPSTPQTPVTFDDSDDEQDISTNYSGSIPDAATIFAAKKKRELARQTGSNADFIPLGSTDKYEGRFKTNSNSRLIREDDSGSDGERIEFKGSDKGSFPALERRQNVAKALADSNDLSDEEHKQDHELTKWEEEQIRKGVGIPLIQSDSHGDESLPASVGDAYVGNGASVHAGTSTLYPSHTNYTSGYQMNAAPGCYQSMYPDGSNMEQTVSADMIVQRLNERMQSVMQVNRAHLRELEKAGSGRESSLKTITSLERDAEDIADRFKFYQETRGFVLDLIECYNEKVPAINEVHNGVLALYHNRCQTLIDRRRSDIKDHDSEITGKVPAPVSMGEVDEFGRDRGAYEVTARQRRIAERKARQRRRASRRSTHDPDSDSHNSGMSSDEEELGSDKRRFESDMEKLIKQSKEIFNDVVEDFSDVTTILSKFLQWKLAFGDAYKEAYIAMCLPKLFKPLIHLEMLPWNPLLMSCGDFEEMKWYISLLSYCDEHDDNKDDLSLLPSIVERVVVPKLTELVRCAWDPMSTTATKLLAFTVQRLVDDYPTLSLESTPTKALFDAIHSKFRDAVENDIFIPLYPRSLLDSKVSTAMAFLNRQYWSSFKLFRNVMLWNGLLSQRKLIELGLDGILSRYLLVALRQFNSEEENLEKCKMMLNLFPKKWFEGPGKALDGLANYAQYLFTLAGNVYKSSLGYSKEERRKAKVILKKVISMLMNIHAFDIARSVSTQYKIEVD